MRLTTNLSAVSGRKMAKNWAREIAAVNSKFQQSSPEKFGENIGGDFYSKKS
jgi:hypothetical protein